MRNEKLAWRGSRSTPAHDKLSIGRVFEHAIVRFELVAVGDEDIAIGSDDDVRGAVELIVAAACDTGLAKRHQDVAGRRELEDLVTALAVAAGIRDPDVAVRIDVDAVRPRE